MLKLLCRTDVLSWTTSTHLIILGPASVSPYRYTSYIKLSHCSFSSIITIVNISLTHYKEAELLGVFIDQNLIKKSHHWKIWGKFMHYCRYPRNSLIVCVSHFIVHYCCILNYGRITCRNIKWMMTLIDMACWNLLILPNLDFYLMTLVAVAWSNLLVLSIFAAQLEDCIVFHTFCILFLLEWTSYF